MFHAWLVGVIKTILREAGVPEVAIVTEARGLRAANSSRPGDVVALDFFADGRHLVIDAVMTTVYMNTALERAATIPGFAAKQAEDRKFRADRTSSQPISAAHGAHTSWSHSRLRMEADWGRTHKPYYDPWHQRHLPRGAPPPFARGVDKLTHNMQISLWFRRWQQRLSAWVHLSISRHAVRLLCPDVAARGHHL